ARADVEDGPALVGRPSRRGHADPGTAEIGPPAVEPAQDGAAAVLPRPAASAADLRRAGRKGELRARRAAVAGLRETGSRRETESDRHEAAQGDSSAAKSGHGLSLACWLVDRPPIHVAGHVGIGDRAPRTASRSGEASN